SGKDVTIEGIGTDAQINGWGIHFICESGNPSLGKSFEVRNLKFRNVPEDCIGMEGVQEGSTLTAPVERCWVHNNEFYAPSISNPAESDKAGGDGACDFKRGNYFTMSYNYYESYHKTNLVGASDSNLQFHITFHHNYWKKCESRGPLARQANIHMYNNVFEGQTSYCQNPRADAYIFSEYNLFDSCKNPQQIKQGAIKSYNDTLINCRGDMQATVVSSKSQKVSSNNRYGDFDTNSSLSYIPSNSYQLLTDTGSLKSYFGTWGGTLDDQNKSGSFPAPLQLPPKQLQQLQPPQRKPIQPGKNYF
ncbi:MAG: polysaccharide lyase, partial [Oscillospiraceae bacterium]|nr:polysaccharide lyase [Oscillospiraceae bacterium]